MKVTQILVASASLVLPQFLASTSAATAAYRNAVLGDGAAAYFQFDEVSGTVASDVSLTLGGANDGSIVGGVLLNQASAYANLGTAFRFDGTRRVRITDNSVFDFGTGAFTIEMWFQTAVDARGDLFTYKGGSGDFGIHSNSQADPSGFDASVSVYLGGFVAPEAGANLNLWHHFAVTRDNASAFSIYIDGTLRASGTNGNTMDIASDLLIGSNHSGDPANAALQFNGLIDEVAIYPTALSEAQIDNHIALAVPEPATVAMLALGTMGLLQRKRSARR